MNKRIKPCAAALFITLAVACLPAFGSPVTFWFGGKLDSVSNPSNALPAGISIGTPFSGRISYDPVWIGSSNWNTYASGDTMNAYFTNTTGFSMLVQVGGHTLTNAPNPEGYPCGYVGVYDQFNDCDSLTLESGSSDIIVDGGSTLSGNQYPVVTLYLRDSSKTIYSSASLPANPPSLAQFPDNRDFSWMVLVDDGKGTVVYSVSGRVDTISTNPIVGLNIRRSGSDAVQLGWPLAVSGFEAQYSTNATAGSWQAVPNPVTDIGMEHTVTVPVSSGARLFRLKSQ